MNNITIDENFDKIKSILYGNYNIEKKIMEQILKKYPISIDTIIVETVDQLINDTKLYWEPLKKIQFFKGTEQKTDPHASISNYHFLTTPGYTDQYEVDTYGNIESKIIRCANYNKYFIISQKTNNCVPKDVVTLNPIIYDSMDINDFFKFSIIEDAKENITSNDQIASEFCFYDLDAYKDKNAKHNVNEEAVTTVFLETFKKHYREHINTIINEFQERISRTIQEKSLELATSEDKYNDINRIISYNNDFLDRLNFHTIDDFNTRIYNMHFNRKTDQAHSLPDVDKIIKIMENLNNEIKQKRDDQFSEQIFNFETNEKGEKGWNWFLNFSYGDMDKYLFEGKTSYFVKVNPELFKTLPEINNIINNLKFEFRENPDYKDTYYTSKDYEPSIPEVCFRTYKTGSIHPIYAGEEISLETLNQKLVELKKLAEKIKSFDCALNINDPEIIKLMSDNIKCVYNFTDDDHLESTVTEKMKDKNYWYNRSSSYSGYTFSDYYYQIIGYIRSIQYLIELANQNKEKADYFKERAKTYQDLFEGHKKYMRNQYLYKERDQLHDQINSLKEDLRSLNSAYATFSPQKPDTYKKKRD